MSSHTLWVALQSCCERLTALKPHRIFYWIGSRYDTALLFQAVLTVAVQIVLLHVALLNRPPMPRHKPFAHAHESASSRRPLRFWQWRTRRPYWEFLAYYSAFLVALQYVIGTHDGYVGLQGYVALGVEAMLPLPQILENQRSQSCKGFRFSVLVNWLVGDAFKACATDPSRHVRTQRSA